MIPQYIDESTESHAERELFHRLRNDESTKDWVILHSLGLANHPRNIEGEADFVVIAPGHGILVLEVKGVSNKNLRRTEDGLWYYSAHGRPDNRGPFRQASEAMHALRNHLTGLAPVRGVPFVSGVIFPNARFSIASPEWHEWEYINSDQYNSRPIGELLRAMILRGKDHIQSVENHPYLDPAAPSTEQCEKILGLLRPSFDIPFDFNVIRKKNREEVSRFTEEQFSALDNMGRNPRVVFTGPAGTGKTFLAMEAARRAALEGQRVLFLCFNSQLRDWIRSQITEVSELIVADSIHSYMLSLAGSPVPANASSEYWETTLPEEASNGLLQRSDSGIPTVLYDTLILDEAQDLLQDNFLDFLDLSLKGGLANGRWRMFGDFDHQVVYANQRISLDQFLQERGSGSPVFSLTTNCRNSPEISHWAEVLASITPGYSDVRRNSSGIDPVISFYSTPEEQTSLLLRAFTELQNKGYKGADIVVLSARTDRESAAATVTQSPWKERLKAGKRQQGGYIQYCTVHSFKGLESEAVIVTDIDSISRPRDKTLLYVALTRPLDQLYVLASEQARTQFIQEFESLRDRG